MITVAVAADKAFARQLAVVVAGLTRSRGDAPYEVFAIHDGYPAALMSRVEASAGDGVTVRWIDGRSPHLRAAKLPKGDGERL